MKVEATKKFRDLKKGVIRETEDRFEVTRARFKELEKKGLVKEVKKEPEEKTVE